MKELIRVYWDSLDETNQSASHENAGHVFSTRIIFMV